MTLMADSQTLKAKANADEYDIEAGEAFDEALNDIFMIFLVNKSFMKEIPDKRFPKLLYVAAKNVLSIIRKIKARSATEMDYRPMKKRLGETAEEFIELYKSTFP